MQVFIPTIARPENLWKLLPAWDKVLEDIFLVVQEDQLEAYEAVSSIIELDGDLNYMVLPESVKGIGAIRNWITMQAYELGYPTVLMSDDDIMPHWSSNMSYSEDILASNSDILGVGCITSYHGLLLDDRKYMMKGDAPIFARSGYGFRMFRFDTTRALLCGNFDEELHTAFEDAELMRQGISRGLLWYLDPHMKGVTTGKRYEPGGIAYFTDNAEARKSMEEECYEICFRAWPKYLAKPPRRRMMWQKMLNDYVPDWREL